MTNLDSDGLRLFMQDLSVITPSADDDGRIYLHDGTGSLTLVTGETASAQGHYLWDNTAGAWDGVFHDAMTLDGYDSTDFAFAVDTYTKTESDGRYYTKTTVDSTFAPLASPSFTGTPEVTGANTQLHLRDTTAGAVIASLATEVDGKLIDFGTNYSQGGPVDSTQAGGFFRIDTRDAYSPDELFTVKHISSAGTVAHVLNVGTSTITYNGNSVWHAGNDGATSGLDADLLDGQHASAFADAGHLHDTRYYTKTLADSTFVDAAGDSMTGSLSVSGGGLTITGPDDAAATVSFTPGTDTAATGTPSMTVDIDGSDLVDGVTTVWDTVSGHVPSAVVQGLDTHTADTANPHSVTATQAGAYAKAEADSAFVGVAGDTMSGNLEFTSGKIKMSQAAPSDLFWAVNTGTAGSQVTTRIDDTDYRIWGYDTSQTAGGEIIRFHYDTKNVSIPTGKLLIGGSEAWHSGNDGAASGLDADLFHGLGPSSFMRSNTAESFTGASVDWGNAEQVNFALDQRTTDPATPAVGQMWYRSDLD